MTGPVVAVYDPSRYPFSLAAVIGCADRDHAAAVVAELRAEYPAGIVTVVYDTTEQACRDRHPSTGGPQ